MTAKPRDDMAAAAAGRGRLRASHADREHVLDVLKAAFVQGRLTKDEFDMRVGQTFASRTYAELAALTANIPAGLIGVQPLRKPARAEAPHPGQAGRSGRIFARRVQAKKGPRWPPDGIRVTLLIVLVGRHR